VGTLAAKSSPPKARGAAFGLMGAVSSLGFGAGPLLGGGLAAVLGMRAVFAIAACLIGAIPLCFLAATAAAPMLRGTRRAAGQVAIRGR
jgi:MFS family permease